MKKEIITILVAGLVVGIISSLLVLAGNPVNMGFCIACFIRDTAGALKLHTAPVVQYARPEIIGLVIGSFVMAFASKEFSARGGSSPLLRFVLGFFVMVGALTFLGCPLRMVLRLAGGDFNAILGIVGFAIGIFVGVLFLKNGFSFKRNYELPKIEGMTISIIQVIIFILLIAAPSLLVFSEKGPGSLHAGIGISLVAGLVVGALAQKSRLCLAGGIRDVILFKDYKLIIGFVCIFIGCFVVNLVIGKFNPGFAGQPVAHSDGLWNALGMFLVGFASILLGGCPLRQLIMAGEGNVDSAITVIGLTVGAAFCHNFGLAGVAASADVVGGASANGKVAVIVGIIVTAIIGLTNINTNKK